MKYVFWVGILLIAGCGGNEQEGFEAGSAPTIIKIQLSPTSFARSDTGDVTGLFVYLDPNADLSTGILLIRECGQGPEERVVTPFESIDVRAVGTFVVEFAINTNCDPGDYSARFYVVDERGNTSNQIEFNYTIKDTNIR